MKRSPFHRAGLARAAASAILLLLAIGAFEPFYLRMFVADRDVLGRHLVELPYRKLPTLRTFLLDAREQTASGETLVFLAPFDSFEGGYRYAFGRAAYLLAGRRVLPVIGRDDAPLIENLRAADAAVAWKAPPPRGFEPVWVGADGSVSRPLP